MSVFADRVVDALGYPHFEQAPESTDRIKIRSGYEPCEWCGTRVYFYDGLAGRGLVEVVRVDIAQGAERGMIRGRWHTGERCNTARRGPAQGGLW